MTESLASLHRLVWTALMAALMAAGAFLNLPLGPVPFTLQTLFVFLAGYVLGPVHGPAAVLLYIAAGAAGLPVFSGGKSGLAVLLGPTGGYLAGFVLCAAVTGLARKGDKDSWPLLAALGLAGLVFVYGLGLVQLALVTGMDWKRAVAVGLLPFLPGCVVKMALAILAYQGLRKNGLLPR